MVLPPYVYGVFPGDREESAAFWCQRKSDTGGLTFLLVFKTKTGGIPGGCPSVIEWKRGRPRGLALSGNPHVPLAGYRSLSDPTVAVSDSMTTAYAPLSDYYDGVERLFYCHRGSWLLRVVE